MKRVMKLKMRKAIVWTWIAAGVCLVPSGALCADADEEKTLVMESMTVTANKMEEDILDVPQSITVIDETVLDEKGITDIPEVIREIPNMEVATGVHGTAVSFRGLNSSMFTNSNPVVLYIDGIPIIDRYGFDASLANVEQIEVLRGPQGTLYGKDAIGGVVNIVTKIPDNDWQGKVGVEYGSNNYMQGMFNTSGVLARDTLFLGVNGEYRQDDGWIENINPGLDSDANPSKTQRISSYLLFTPTKRFSARLTVANDINEEEWTDGYAPPSGTAFDDINRDDAEEVDFDMPTGIERTTFSQSLHLSYDFDKTILSSTSTHSNMNIEGDYDADYGNSSYYAGLEQWHYSELDTYTQELRLASNNESGIRWVGGIYFESEESENGPYGSQFPYFDEPVVNGSYTYYGNYEMTADSVLESTTYAAFGQVMIPLAEPFELTLGGRYQHIEKEIDSDTYYLPIGMAGSPFFSLSGEIEWEAFLPKAALNYNLNESWSAYVSYSQGYMPGGFNFFASSGTIEDNSFEPQKSANYEIGIKGTMDRLQASATLFYMDIEDIHVYKASGMNYYTENAEKAHSQGIEVDLSYRLTDAVDLTAALGLIDAKYDSYDAGEGVFYDGQEIQNTPAYTAAAGVSYTHPGGFYSRVDMRAGGDVYFYDDANKTFVKEDSYSTVDARIGYLAGDWDFYVYGKNLADEEYIVDYISSASLSVASFGDPRTFGAGIRYRF